MQRQPKCRRSDRNEARCASLPRSVRTRTRMSEQPVSLVMNPSVCIVSASDLVGVAAKAMLDAGSTSAVVTDGDAIVGILTKTDLLKAALAKGSDLKTARVSQIMSSPVQAVSARQSVFEAAQLLAQLGAKQLPVVEDGRVVGIVFQMDLVDLITEDCLADDTPGHERTHKELRRVKAELAEVTQRAHQMAARAAAAESAMNRLVANLMHEVRTPMNAIIGFSKVLESEPLTEEQKQYVGYIKESALNLLAVANDLLDLSRIEAGTLEIQKTDCSLTHLFALLESEVRPQATEKGLSFEIFISPDVPRRIRTDPVRLRQCLLKLISNAVRFTDQGHVYVKVSTQSVDGAVFLRFDVEDTGMGIAPEQQEMIFELFKRSDDSSSRKRSGSGLSLAITKQLARLLGGDVAVASELGKGSTFSLWIPAEVAEQTHGSDDAPAPSHEQTEQPKQVAPKLTGKVLVAEDIRTNQQLIRVLLNRFGLDISIAKDGHEAVEKALSEPFDLVIMDIQMPGMDGLEATQRLRQKGFKAPIIALTAYATDQAKAQCLEAGCDDYLAKPIETQQLISLLNKYLKCATGSHSQTQTTSSKPHQSTPPQVQPQTDQVQGQIIDWERLVDRLMDENLISDVIPVYLEDNKQRMQKLAEAVAAGRADQVKLYAHAIKGAAANMGATRLTELAYQLECAGRDGDRDKIETLFPQVQAEFNRVVEFLSKDNWMEIAKTAAYPQPVA